ncbi:MAG TPA: glycosyl transferase family 2, partial [Mucilaginibacter sp.]
MSSSKQVFQADNPGRWNRFKWLSRILLAALVIGIIAVIVTIRSTYYPELPNLNPAPKKMTKEELEKLKQSTKFKSFKIQKSEIEALERAKRLHQLKQPNNKDRINAAFYRAWEPQAYNSLVVNISHLDMVVSEGFFIAPNTDTVITKLDTGLMNLNKKYNKPIIVSLSNYVNKDNASGGYDTKDVERIVNNKVLRGNFINSIVNSLTKNKLKGINVDFDELKDRNSKNYTTFQKELYETLHAKGFLVTQ